MASFVLLEGNDCQFKVHREDLMKIDYFRGMLTNDPPSLYLAFPCDIMRDIVGLIQHGSDWHVQDNPNLRLALRYVGIDYVPDECLTIDEYIEKVKHTKWPIESVNYTNGVKLSRPFLFLLFEGNSHGWIKAYKCRPLTPENLLFEMKEEKYDRYFHIREGYLVLKEKYLALLARHPGTEIYTENKSFKIVCQCK